ncbi:MAG: hypothetical protein IAF02_07100 [Anaerolineae bacterium]|nr:hypothetical protein [Anaerolineae bacterium]
MVKKIKALFIFSIIMLTHSVLMALPQSPLDMNNNYADWKGGTGGAATCFVDEGGVDDSNLNRADITEYCLHIDSSETGGLYLLMAMDDTEPQNAEVRIVLDVDGNLTPDYSVSDTLSYHPRRGLSIDGGNVSRCGDSACTLNNLVLICDNGDDTVCTGMTEGFNNNWPSAFRSNKCDGVNCTTLDGFIEMFVPWQWLGGTPPDSYLFGLYLSAHSGGTEDTSADNTGQGIACNANGCYTSGPTAVTLQSFNAMSEKGMTIWPFLFIMLLSSGYVLGKRFKPSRLLHR